MTDINYQEGLTPKQATIVNITHKQSYRHGGDIYEVLFDTGWNCWVDPRNKNWKRWRAICEQDLRCTVKGLRAKIKAKRLYDADSPIQIVDVVKDQPTPYDQLFDAEPYQLSACDIDTVEVLLRDLLPREYPQFQANCDDSETELHLNVNNVRYIIPIV